MKKKKKEKLVWYNNPGLITTILICLTFVNVILSQSFAIKNGLSVANLLNVILSHNTIYLILFVYFILLKTEFGKKYFNFLNIFLMLIFVITSFTSLLSVFQSVTLNSVINFIMQFVILLYLIHTFFRGTRLWKDLKLSKSPFNEFTNDGFFYIIVVLNIIYLADNLITATTVDGTILSLLDSVFLIIFSRYIYLYWDYLDIKKIDSKNKGNFKDNEFIKEQIDNISDKVDDFIEDNDIDDKIDNIKEKVSKFEFVDEKDKK